MNPNTMYKEFQRLADSDSTTEWTSYDWFKAGCTYSNENVNIMQEKKVRHKKTLKLTRVDRLSYRGEYWLERILLGLTRYINRSIVG